MMHNFDGKTAWKTEKQFEGQYNDISQGHRLLEREEDGHESGQYPLNGDSNKHLDSSLPAEFCVKH
jgi:hypothetical protein